MQPLTDFFSQQFAQQLHGYDPDKNAGFSSPCFSAWLWSGNLDSLELISFWRSLTGATSGVANIEDACWCWYDGPRQCDRLSFDDVRNCNSCSHAGLRKRPRIPGFRVLFVPYSGLWWNWRVTTWHGISWWGEGIWSAQWAYLGTRFVEVIKTCHRCPPFLVKDAYRKFEIKNQACRIWQRCLVSPLFAT